MKSSEQDIASMFDNIAPTYDFLNRLLSLRQDQRWRKQLIKRLPKARCGRLVDVATGTGDILCQAAKSRPDYSEFWGVDISERMLALAKLKATQHAVKATFTRMSAESLDFDDSSVDCLTISFGLRNVINKEKALNEFIRVLKPKGHLIILEFFTPQSGLLAWFFQLYFHHILPRIGGFFSDKDAYTYLPTSVDKFYSYPQLAALLTSAGYAIKECKPLLLGGCRLIDCEKS